MQRKSWRIVSERSKTQKLPLNLIFLQNRAPLRQSFDQMRKMWNQTKKVQNKSFRELSTFGIGFMKSSSLIKLLDPQVVQHRTDQTETLADNIERRFSTNNIAVVLCKFNVSSLSFQCCDAFHAYAFYVRRKLSFRRLYRNFLQATLMQSKPL